MKKIVLANLKIILSLSFLFFVGFMVGCPLLYGWKIGVLVPLGLALLLYLYYGGFYLIALLILNWIYFKKISNSQKKIYLSGLFITNFLILLLYSESIQSSEFLWTIVIANTLTVLLIYISKRIFEEDIPELM